MTMRESQVCQKQVLRELMHQAREEELRRALAELANDFDAWRAAKIDNDALNRCIHKFHQHTSREIAIRYEMGDHIALVANAVATGILASRNVPDELFHDMERLIAYFRVASVKDQAGTPEAKANPDAARNRELAVAC